MLRKPYAQVKTVKNPTSRRPSEATQEAMNSLLAMRSSHFEPFSTISTKIPLGGPTRGLPFNPLWANDPCLWGGVLYSCGCCDCSRLLCSTTTSLLFMFLCMPRRRSRGGWAPWGSYKTVLYILPAGNYFFAFFRQVLDPDGPYGPPWPSPGLPDLRFDSLDLQKSGLDQFSTKTFFATLENRI